MAELPPFPKHVWLVALRDTVRWLETIPDLPPAPGEAAGGKVTVTVNEEKTDGRS